MVVAATKRWLPRGSSASWSSVTQLLLRDEADALDGGVVHYVESLIRELRVRELAFDFGPSVTMARRITILRHVDAAKRRLCGAHAGVAAYLVMTDAPVLMLVEP